MKLPVHVPVDMPNYVEDSEKILIARCYGGSESAEVARRIVACLNALAGVSTEHLEQYGLPDFAQKISDLAQQRDALAAENDKLSKSLAAAKNVIKSQEWTISHMRNKADQNKEAVATLDSERAANAAMTDELDYLLGIKEAALNLYNVRGRHNSEIAMNRLIEALDPHGRARKKK